MTPPGQKLKLSQGRKVNRENYKLSGLFRQTPYFIVWRPSKLPRESVSLPTGQNPEGILQSHIHPRVRLSQLTFLVK